MFSKVKHREEREALEKVEQEGSRGDKEQIEEPT